MSDPNLIADLAAAGLDPMLLQRVALEIGRARAATEAIERRRTADKERQAKRRNVMSRDSGSAGPANTAVVSGNNHVMSRDVTLQHVTPQTSADGAPNDPSPLPPHTPPITPNPNTPSDPDGSAPPSGASEQAGGGDGADDALPAEGAPYDPRLDLFSRGKDTIQKMTGRPDPVVRALLGKWLRFCDDDALTIVLAIDAAVEHKPADVVSFIVGKLRSDVAAWDTKLEKPPTRGSLDRLLNASSRRALLLRQIKRDHDAPDDSPAPRYDDGSPVIDHEGDGRSDPDLLGGAGGDPRRVPPNGHLRVASSRHR